MPGKSKAPVASLTVAERCRREGRLAEAADICRGVVAAQPDSDEPWHLLGVIAQQRGNSSEAVMCFERAVGLAPTVARHHANLSEIYRAVGRLDEAAAAAERALALDPGLPEPLNNLARIATTIGDSARALDCSRRASYTSAASPGRPLPPVALDHNLTKK